MTDETIREGYWGVDGPNTHGQPTLDIWFEADDPNVGRNRGIGPDYIISGTIDDVLEAFSPDGKYHDDVIGYEDDLGEPMEIESMLDLDEGGMTPDEEKLVTEWNTMNERRFDARQAECTDDDGEDEC